MITVQGFLCKLVLAGTKEEEQPSAQIHPIAACRPQGREEHAP